MDISAIIKELMANDVFNGVLGGSLVTGLLYSMRQLPGKMLGLLSWRFTSTLTIYNDDSAFERVSEWLSELSYAKRRRLSL